MASPFRYVFAIFGHHFLYADFVDAAGLNACDDLLSCWKTIVLEGMRHGDIGDSIMLRPHADSHLQPAFVLLFWMVVVTILLNLLFGIIAEFCTEQAHRRPHREPERAPWLLL